MNFITIDKYDIDYEYQPEEPMELEYPGCDEDVEIDKVFVGNRNITGILGSDKIEELETQVLEALKNY